MTLEVKQKFYGKLLDYGVGLALMAIVMFYQHKDNIEIKNDLKATKKEFKDFILGEYKGSIKIIDLNNHLFVRVEQGLNR